MLDLMKTEMERGNCAAYHYTPISQLYIGSDGLTLFYYFKTRILVCAGNPGTQEWKYRPTRNPIELYEYDIIAMGRTKTIIVL